MRPLAVLIAIVFGSAAAMSFGLLATIVVLVFLKDRYPEYGAELVPLMVASSVVLAVAASSGASLYSTLRQLRWHPLALVVMCLILLGAVWYLWPAPQG